MYDIIILVIMMYSYIKGIVKDQESNYIVLDPADSGLSYKQILTEKEYQDARESYGYNFRVGMGAESIKELLEAIDLDKDAAELKKAIEEYEKRLSNVSVSMVYIKNQKEIQVNIEGVITETNEVYNYSTSIKIWN